MNLPTEVRQKEGTLGTCSLLGSPVTLIYRIAPSFVADQTMTTLRCSDCGGIVELARRQNNTLLVKCACGKGQSVKVAGKIPDGWTA